MRHALAVAAPALLVVVPLLVAARDAVLARRSDDTPAARVPWASTWSSALLYTLAFNVTFFIQELFLVLPKALTPGLQPTLYHNNHDWDGRHPLAELFQGTGALAILLSAIVCASLVRRARRPAWRVFLIWMAFHGSLQALLQLVVAAVLPASDVGRAFTWLQLGPRARTSIAALALVAVPAVARGTTRRLLTLADGDATAVTTTDRARVTWRLATVPALLAVLPILLYRVPRELPEVVLPPTVVGIVGAAWMQAWSRRAGAVTGRGGSAALPVATPLAAAVLLLAVFHLVLRPGVRFY